jgi:hypothetical protein
MSTVESLKPDRAWSSEIISARNKARTDINATKSERIRPDTKRIIVKAKIAKVRIMNALPLSALSSTYF